MGVEILAKARLTLIEPADTPATEPTTTAIAA
jgi:hypothetical protein